MAGYNAYNDTFGPSPDESEPLPSTASLKPAFSKAELDEFRTIPGAVGFIDKNVLKVITDPESQKSKLIIDDQQYDLEAVKIPRQATLSGVYKFEKDNQTLMVYRSGNNEWHILPKGFDPSIEH